MLPISAAADRNKHPIGQALQSLLPAPCRVLEIGSGTGQHAVHFCNLLPHLTWYPTEIAENMEILLARIASEGSPNLRHPFVLDVTQHPWPLDFSFETVFTANTFHILSETAVKALITGGSAALTPGGLLIVYGPFNRGGQFTSQGNAQFDAVLRQRDPKSGIRDCEWVIQLCRKSEMTLVEDMTMPANNRLLIFRKAS